MIATVAHGRLLVNGGNLQVDPPPNLPASLEALVDSMDTDRLSKRSRELMSEFKSDPHAVVLLFKAAPLGHVPKDTLKRDALNSSPLSKWVLGTVTKFMGALVGYEELDSRRLFKDIFTGPRPSDTSYIGNYTTGDSDRYFGWHVENLAHPNMPRYVLMQCLRQDDQRVTETLLLPGESVVEKLSAASIEVLKQKRFALDVEDTLDLDNVTNIPEPIAVLSEESPRGAWRINLDSSFMRPFRKDDSVAQEAFDELLAAAESSFITLNLEAGDLIIWDNIRLAHDRQYSGTNRWLQRTHAYTGSVTPFHMFQDIEVEFVGDSDPYVVQTKGVYQKVLSRHEL